MQNLNEEDFKKKYLKYKAKYLELKDLLEGGLPQKTEAEIEEETKKFCTDGKKDSCPKVYGCTAGKWYGCNFDKNEYKRQKDEAEIVARLNAEHRNMMKKENQGIKY